MRNFGNKIWFNGTLIDWDKAYLHVISHALHYGTAVFEGIRCYKTNKGRAVFRLNDHLKRLFYSASCLGMKMPFSGDQIKKAILSLVRTNQLDDCYIRPIVFYNSDQMSLLPDSEKVAVAVACWPWVLKAGAMDGVKVKTSRFIRPHPHSVPVDAKVSGYYVNSLLANREAKKTGFDEALLLDYRGYIAEGPGENIFLVKNGKLITPAKGCILPGITRESIIQLAKVKGIKIIEKNLKPKELRQAKEAFFVGTAAEVWPILQVDGRKIGDGKIGAVTRILAKEYQAVIRGRNKRYSSWLTPVN